MIDQLFAYSGDLQAALANGKANKATAGQTGTVAIISILGPMSRTGVVGRYEAGTATNQVAGDLAKAAADPAVAGIILYVASGGGTVTGTDDLARAVRAAGTVKPVSAFIDDVGASAAYWVASQAGRLFIAPTAAVGGIGTYGVVTDMSGLANAIGFKVHVVRAGHFKGMATPGTEITAEQLAEMQRVVDGLNAHFLAGVASGRRMPPARAAELADGRVHIGAEAVRLGLADGVAAWGDFVRAFVAQVTPPPAKADHVAQWDAAITRRMQAGATRAQAITATATSDPELHGRYLEEFNARQRAVARN